jgi:hypothetical protein
MCLNGISRNSHTKWNYKYVFRYNITGSVTPQLSDLQEAKK